MTADIQASWMKYLESDTGYSIIEFRTQLIFLLSPTPFTSLRRISKITSVLFTRWKINEIHVRQNPRETRVNEITVPQSSIIIFLTLEGL